MHDRVRSLNLSNAVAIVAYEAVRQWQLADIRNAVDERVGS
jgi:tRNA(Leu) C34 or U34 (ribose-2'-O)-methylase TrmL